MSTLKRKEERVLNPQELESLKGMVEEVVNSKYKIDGYRDFIKEVKKRAKDELEIPTKRFNDLVEIAYQQNGSELDHEVNEVLDLAETLGYYKRED